MLQMRTLSRRALERMPPLPRWSSVGELEAATDITLASFRRQRQRLGSTGAPWERAQVWLDRRLRTVMFMIFAKRPTAEEAASNEDTQHAQPPPPAHGVPA